MNTCERCKKEQKDGELLTYVDDAGWCWGCVEQTRHDAGKALMAKERQAIVAWLRRLAGDTNPIAKLIEDGQHWKNQP